MAFDTQARIGITLLDELGEGDVMSLYSLVDSTRTIGQVMADLLALAVTVDEISSAQITALRLTLPSTLAGLKGAPVGGSRVEQNALFTTRNARTHGRYAQPVPSWYDTLILARVVDLTNPAVIAFSSILTAGWASGLFSTPQFDAITSIEDVRLAYRRRRHQLSRTSLQLA